MMTNDMFLQGESIYNGPPDSEWLSGFLAGREVVGSRTPDWRWKPFIEDIEQLIHAYGVDQVIYPCSDLPPSTVLAALGGYISVTGEVTEYSLRFPMEFMRQNVLRRVLTGVEISEGSGQVQIPLHDIEELARQVRLEGPLLELLEGALEEDD